MPLSLAELEPLSQLSYLVLDNNQIRDLQPLADFTPLHGLHLFSKSCSDWATLVALLEL